MSKTLFALLFPFFNLKFNFGDDDGGAVASDKPSQPGASTAAEPAKPDVPASTETASTETDDKQPEKALTQAEVDAIVQKRLAKERR
ncbi:MAG TPA: hypothetical protein VFS17_03645, partial [Methylophilaceae bacterium]|nr:hypothetical protein [Methylophilaceae bacterium]